MKYLQYHIFGNLYIMQQTLCWQDYITIQTKSALQSILQSSGTSQVTKI